MVNKWSFQDCLYISSHLSNIVIFDKIYIIERTYPSLDE